MASTSTSHATSNITSNITPDTADALPSVAEQLATLPLLPSVQAHIDAFVDEVFAGKSFLPTGKLLQSAVDNECPDQLILKALVQFPLSYATAMLDHGRDEPDYRAVLHERVGVRWCLTNVCLRYFRPDSDDKITLEVTNMAVGIVQYPYVHNVGTVIRPSYMRQLLTCRPLLKKTIQYLKDRCKLHDIWSLCRPNEPITCELVPADGQDIEDPTEEVFAHIHIHLAYRLDKRQKDRLESELTDMEMESDMDLERIPDRHVSVGELVAADADILTYLKDDMAKTGSTEPDTSIELFGTIQVSNATYSWLKSE